MQPNGGLLGGRYELTALIATGGMGQVWQARDTVLNRDVAVKVLRSEYTGDPTFRARFRSEAQLAAGLIHPNIATLFDYGEVVPTDPRGEHLAYLVMELVRGESLSELLRREGRLSPDRTLDILRQSAAGLAAAHANGVVHRDVKPGNLLLGTDGTVKITDFGVAVSAASVSLTQTGQVIGTPHYLSPEQTHGARATPASDVYALGVVGYECLAGRRVFEAETAVQVLLMQMRDTPDPLPADVPPTVRQLIESALVKDPAVRYPDGAAFRDAVDDVIAGRAPRTALPHDPTALLPSVPLSTAPMPAVAAPPLAATQAMPAVSAGYEDDEPAEQDGDPRRWRRLLLPLIALLAVAGIALGGWQLMSSTSDGGGGTAAAPSSTAAPTSSTPSSAPTTPTVRLVDLTSSDYVGRPVGDVQTELTAKGLIVTLVAQQNGGVADGLVTAVDPSGPLPPNSPVTVTYAVAPPPPPPTTAAPSPAPESTQEGEGNGNGDQGNGNEGNGDEGDGDEGNGDEGNGNGGRGNGNGRGNGDG